MVINAENLPAIGSGKGKSVAADSQAPCPEKAGQYSVNRVGDRKRKVNPD
jgi:hypothetical protein